MTSKGRAESQNGQICKCFDIVNFNSAGARDHFSMYFWHLWPLGTYRFLKDGLAAEILKCARRSVFASKQRSQAKAGRWTHFTIKLYFQMGTLLTTGNILIFSVIFNNQPFHAIAISLASMGQAMLNLFTDGTYKITITNHPLPRTEGKSIHIVFICVCKVQSIYNMNIVYFGNLLVGYPFVTTL